MLLLQVLTPNSQQWETVSTARFDDTMTLVQKADELEGLAENKDAWIASGYFSAETKWRCIRHIKGCDLQPAPVLPRLDGGEV